MSARACEVTVFDKRLGLAVPTTYMNDSGVAIRPLARRYVDNDLSRLVVVHDELDLPTGVVRVKVGGGTAGHNGLRSAESHLRSLDFVRVRIGIGKAPGQSSGRDHVLRRPGKVEKEILAVGLELAADAVEAILAEGPERAMNTFNAR